MSEPSDREACEDWWATSIIEMRPGVIRYRGYAIEELIGRVGFPGMIWLMLRGELPSEGEAELLGTALMAAVDHGPQAPSIAIARMAATCGVGINNAMASAINVLGDVHGGAGEQCVELYQADRRPRRRVAPTLPPRSRPSSTRPTGFSSSPASAIASTRRPARTAAARAGRGGSGQGRGRRRLRRHRPRGRGGAGPAQGRRRIPMNIDGATAVIYAELGFPPPLCRGLFVLSRSVGALAHAWEEMQSGQRNKGPIPRRYLWRYDGPPPRPVPTDG